MKIYLCSRYSRRDEMRTVRAELERYGHTITSRWLNTIWEEQDEAGSAAAPPEYRQEYAVKDMEDVCACDCLITFTEQPRSGGRGGRHVEYGAALALGKRLVVVGFRENLFHEHPQVTFFEDTVGMLNAMQTDGMPGPYTWPIVERRSEK